MLDPLNDASFSFHSRGYGNKKSRSTGVSMICQAFIKEFLNNFIKKKSRTGITAQLFEWNIIDNNRLEHNSQFEIDLVHHHFGCQCRPVGQ